MFAKNTLIFCMHGGYFTSPECLLDDEPVLARITTMSMNPNDVRKSYTVDALTKCVSSNFSFFIAVKINFLFLK